MWRKPSVSSALSGASCGGDGPAPRPAAYPCAVALRVRVLQIVCGIGATVVGAVGWLEERRRVALGLGVPTGAVTVLAAATSIYFSRGFGGWSRHRALAAPWRALGPTARAAAPLALLWGLAVLAHVGMLTVCIRAFMNAACSRTSAGVAGAQLALSLLTLAAQAYMLRLDLRHDPAASPAPRLSDAHCTAVSMVPLTSTVATSGGSSEEPAASSPGGDSEARPLEPT